MVTKRKKEVKIGIVTKTLIYPTATISSIPDFIFGGKKAGIKEFKRTKRLWTQWEKQLKQEKIKRKIRELRKYKLN